MSSRRSHWEPQIVVGAQHVRQPEDQFGRPAVNHGAAADRLSGRSPIQLPTHRQPAMPYGVPSAPTAYMEHDRTAAHFYRTDTAAMLKPNPLPQHSILPPFAAHPAQSWSVPASCHPPQQPALYASSGSARSPASLLAAHTTPHTTRSSSLSRSHQVAPATSVSGPQAALTSPGARRPRVSDQTGQGSLQRRTAGRSAVDAPVSHRLSSETVDWQTGRLDTRFSSTSSTGRGPPPGATLHPSQQSYSTLTTSSSLRRRGIVSDSAEASSKGLRRGRSVPSSKGCAGLTGATSRGAGSACTPLTAIPSPAAAAMLTDQVTSMHMSTRSSTLQAGRCGSAAHVLRDTSAPPGARQARRSSSSAGAIPTNRSNLRGILRTSDSSKTAATSRRGSSVAAVDRHEVARVVGLRRGYGVAGLQNLGNTCFMNSMLQCLGCVPDLVDAIFSGEFAPKSGARVAPPFAAMLKAIAEMCPPSFFSPDKFLRRMSEGDAKWGRGSQQDSHEFLLALLDTLQLECDRNLRKPQYRELKGNGTEEQQAHEASEYARLWSDSIVDDIFGGLLQSTIVCEECGHESYCFDTCCDVSLPVSSSHACSVNSCWKKFTEEETLDSSYECEGCQADTHKRKSIRLYTPPRALVLHLNRFSSKGSSSFMFGRSAAFSRMQKNGAAVDVPARLDIAPFCHAVGLCGASGMYDLVAVSEHSGSMGGGHYTATGRALSDGLWYRFNDASVSRADCPDGPSSSAYVLFYRMVPA